MIILVVSDTHENREGSLAYIEEEAKKRNAELVVHCGDIEGRDLGCFKGLPVICALNKEQLEKLPFSLNPPQGWDFTKPGDRIRDVKHVRMYIGHKRSFDFLTGSESKLVQCIDQTRNDHDGLRWFFSGHTHHQIFAQSRMVNFINPGAVEDSFDGHEFAVVNTQNHEIVFCRIPKTQSVTGTFSVGVISDSLYISKEDPSFWSKLVKEFEARDVKDVIHCGNIALDDISYRTFPDNFTVYYNLRPDQQNPKVVPEKWHLIPQNEPVVTINGYKFCVQLDLGADLMDKSEIQLHKIALDLRKKFPEISYILCGLTSDAFYEEGQHIRILNPGDVLKDRNFAVICLPRTEITFGHVPVDPLPPLK